MQLNKTPFFRKAITPWHDSNFACGIIITLMFLIFAFAVVGIIVGSNNPSFEQHAWFPGLLAFLSFFLAVKMLLRLRKRAQSDNDL
jgi:uncharacterized membrane protein YfcA